MEKIRFLIRLGPFKKWITTEYTWADLTGMFMRWGLGEKEAKLATACKHEWLGRVF